MLTIPTKILDQCLHHWWLRN